MIRRKKKRIGGGERGGNGLWRGEVLGRQKRGGKGGERANLTKEKQKLKGKKRQNAHQTKKENNRQVFALREREERQRGRTRVKTIKNKKKKGEKGGSGEIHWLNSFGEFTVSIQGKKI